MLLTQSRQELFQTVPTLLQECKNHQEFFF
jgi:hypothetical protein